MSLDDALRKPTPGPVPDRPPSPPSTEFRVEGTSAEVLVNNARSRSDAGGDEVLRANGLDPEEWIATAFRTSEWTMHGGEQGLSTRWNFTRKPDERPSPPGPPLDDLFAAIEHRPVPARSVEDGSHGFVVALGDMQFGKIDGDGAAGTLDRVLHCLDAARAALDSYRNRYDIGHVHLGWLGDHIEGFQSQGGANVWRTPLTLNEQIRLTRRVMLHGLQLFAESGVPLMSMAAVPGNHGETTRFAGHGVTRYDDSHDTESLISVSDAAALDPNRFGHCRFYVPETDELTLAVDVAGTRIAHAHGHQWKTNRHWDWWSGQDFGRSPIRGAHMLLSGHLHTFHAHADGGRLFVQVPSLEAESTWWRHKTGTGGDPGLVVAVTKDGVTPVLEQIRPPIPRNS
jgi:hypothetical protein